MIQSQKLLLTWLIEHTGLFPKIEKYDKFCPPLFIAYPKSKLSTLQLQ